MRMILCRNKYFDIFVIYLNNYKVSTFIVVDKHVWSLECTVDLYMEVIAGLNDRMVVDKIK